jgi:NAD(P) transhydrogenase subunit alpha
VQGKDGRFDVNMEDEVIRGTTVIKDGNITWPPPAPKLSAAPPAKPAAKPPAVPEKEKASMEAPARPPRRARRHWSF